jgi:hypothetical protein
MSIEGSTVAWLPNAGANIIELPKKGLTVVGLAISTQSVSIPISSGKNAIFMGSPVGTYVFQPVSFVSDSGQINLHTSGADVLIIVYYGSPLPNTPPLSAYAGILISPTITVGASLSSPTLVNTNVKFNFPSSAQNITGMEYSSGELPSGVTGNVIGYLQFAISTGQLINLAIPWANGLYVPDYPSSTGIIPLKVPVTSVVNAVIGGYFTNSNTASSSWGLDVVLYYA